MTKIAKNFVLPLWQIKYIAVRKLKAIWYKMTLIINKQLQEKEEKGKKKTRASSKRKNILSVIVGIIRTWAVQSSHEVQ